MSIGEEGWGTREETYSKIKWGWECTVWEMSCEDGKDGSILEDFIEVKRRRLENGEGSWEMGRGTQGSGTKFLRGLGSILNFFHFSSYSVDNGKAFSSVHLEKSPCQQVGKDWWTGSHAAVSRTKCHGLLRSEK